MTAGRRNVRVLFTRPGGGLDDYGQPVGTTLDLGSAWAAVFYGAGQERRAAAGENAAQVATFEVVSNQATRALQTRDQVQGAGGIWDITAIVPIDRKTIAITGTMAK